MAAILAAGGAGAESPAPDDGPAIRVIQGMCASCHARQPEGGWADISDTARPPRVWRSILWRMSEEYGARLTPDERIAIIEYLSRSER